jgi:hypothetical protein
VNVSVEATTPGDPPGINLASNLELFWAGLSPNCPPHISQLILANPAASLSFSVCDFNLPVS